MGLADRLESGELGFRCRVGELELIEQSQRFASLLHPQRQVSLEIFNAPWRLSARDPYAWRAAIERHARWLFEDSFRSDEELGLGLSHEPRTGDTTWSPLIEFEPIELESNPWWVLLRRNYAPGNEFVEGRLLLPIETGLVTVSLSAQDRTTGYRESALALLHELATTSASWPQVRQAWFDDPKHDAEFPEHCLSRVRRARQWLLDSNGGAFVRTQPVTSTRGGEVVLAEADCAVTPPARFEYLPAGTLPLAPNIASFSSVVLGGNEAPRLLNVWNLGRQLPKPAAASELEALAREMLAGWTQEGARDVRLEVTRVAGALGPEAHVHVHFVTQGTPRQERQIWFTDTDRSVFRIGVDAPTSYAESELSYEVGAVRQSWRRLSPKKRWWRS